jgi:hypothetical protein
MRIFYQNLLRILLPCRFVMLALLSGITAQGLHAQQRTVITSAAKPVPIGGDLAFFVDSSDRYTIQTAAASGKFVRSVNAIPVFQEVVKGTIWVKFSVLNASPDSTLFVDLQYANISRINFYREKNGQPRTGAGRRQFNPVRRG